VEKFDTALKGGLLVGSISEICGAPGAGKTQFCLSCTLQGVVTAQQSASSSGVAAGAQQGAVIYIDTELKFDPNRLIQMAMERYPEMYSSEFRTDAPHQIDRLLDQVKVCLRADSIVGV
jgi:RAD51-like protein 1